MTLVKSVAFRCTQPAQRPLARIVERIQDRMFLDRILEGTGPSPPVFAHAQECSARVYWSPGSNGQRSRWLALPGLNWC